MAKTRELVVRRKAIRNIRKITRTMELIATARFKKAMDRTVEAAAYTKKIAEIAAELSASAQDVTHPLLVKREKARRWQSENQSFISVYNKMVEKEGFPLDEWRSF